MSILVAIIEGEQIYTTVSVELIDPEDTASVYVH